MRWPSFWFNVYACVIVLHPTSTCHIKMKMTKYLYLWNEIIIVLCSLTAGKEHKVIVHRCAFSLYPGSSVVWGSAVNLIRGLVTSLEKNLGLGDYL